MHSDRVVRLVPILSWCHEVEILLKPFVVGKNLSPIEALFVCVLRNGVWRVRSRGIVNLLENFHVHVPHLRVVPSPHVFVQSTVARWEL